MGYTVYYQKAWLTPFGKQTPYPPGFYDSPCGPGEYPAVEVEYIEPISFMGRIMLLVPRWLYFAFRIDSNGWGEEHYAQITYTRNFALNDYLVTFECVGPAELHTEYYYTFDLLYFPGVRIHTKNFSPIGDCQTCEYTGSETNSTRIDGEQDPPVQYGGFRFRFPYNLQGPTLQPAGIVPGALSDFKLQFS